ncbi:MAG: hypothetical protein ACT4OV_05830 [Microthrixaceae bacterium]
MSPTPNRRAPSIDPPLRCGSYRRGHEAHWVQAKVSNEAGHFRHGTATVDADGWITIVLNDGTHLRKWTHDPTRLAQLLDASGREVAVRHHGVLAVPAGGTYIVSVADEPTPCPSPEEDTSGWSLTEILERRGGFMISPNDPLLGT